MLEALGLLNKPTQIVCVVCGNQRWSKLVTTITVLKDLHVVVVVMLVFELGGAGDALISGVLTLSLFI